ncbi:hypothetical protein SDC9_149290 [bioreactor metagenome]|uniref:Uncharacterized protein n=1 Tax=bioreactor metagenome TaxID=1076179 RepID=A0A645EJZ0_9ZZZZ
MGRIPRSSMILTPAHMIKDMQTIPPAMEIRVIPFARQRRIIPIRPILMRRTPSIPIMGMITRSHPPADMAFSRIIMPSSSPPADIPRRSRAGHITMIRTAHMLRGGQAQTIPSAAQPGGPPCLPATRSTAHTLRAATRAAHACRKV